MTHKNKVLLTGANGFLGQYIYKELSETHSIKTLGRANSTYNIDLKLQGFSFDNQYFDLVIHAAGKAHSVPKTADEKQDFYDVNVKGTENLLKALDRLPALPKAFVFISSVAVYGLDCGNSVDEKSRLAATDPYGQSKIKAEDVIINWCEQNNVCCSILRLPLLAGVNPPGNLRSMIKGIKTGFYFNIASGKARKSVVLAEDVAKIIPEVATVGGTFNLTDGYNPSFQELASLIAHQLNRPRPLNMPYFVASLLGSIGDLTGNLFPLNTGTVRKMTKDLTFDDSQARRLLNWSPLRVIDRFRIQ
jgi:nucleoside-diphosphate-sugar epimerase